MIISSKEWDAALPDIIEAVFFCNDGGLAKARKVHSAFLRTYANTSKAAARTPLVRYSTTDGFHEVT